MKEQLQNIKEQALKTIGECVDVKQLDELRVKYLGKKGELTAILKSMGKLSAEERHVMGQLANDVRPVSYTHLHTLKASLPCLPLPLHRPSPFLQPLQKNTYHLSCLYGEGSFL